MKVVLVDDSPQVQHALCRLLAPIDGVQVAGCAEDTRGAAALIETCEPDVVVLDVALRGHDRGYDVLRELMRTRPRTEVVMLSNFGWDAMREAFLQAGARAYFDKALEITRVRDWIRERAARA